MVLILLQVNGYQIQQVLDLPNAIYCCSLRGPKYIEDENLNFGKALMLAIAYSASIGGVATLLGHHLTLY
ncbi:MAG: hypothetical protein CM15mP102_13590 [Flavobacteriales bacterium]|nr:MAG: hypothetical protein CM15mP102_13590 [Flavobacteriales bacterium]